MPVLFVSATIVRPNTLSGLLVPIPTFPLLVTTKFVSVVDPITNAGPVIPLGFTDNCAQGVVVPIPTFPRKYDVALVVAMMFPTVSCVPVAIRLPDELVVMIELAANVVAENTWDASVDVDTVDTRPLVPMNEYPCVRDGRNRDEENVDDAVENRPLVNPIVVDVEL